MQKLTITIALAVIALALGTTAATTTIQIQPAYSQAKHCSSSTEMNQILCVTPGQNPSRSDCTFGICDPDLPITQQEAGKRIGNLHKDCTLGFDICTVTPPNR